MKLKSFVVFTILALVFFGFIATASAMTQAEKTATLDRLQARIVALTARMTELVSLITQVQNQLSITVTSPNGGENWKTGETHNITWTSTGLTNVKITLVDVSDTGISISLPTVIASSVPASQGTYSWNIPTTISAKTSYKVKVEENVGSNVMNRPLVSDSSNSTFTVSTSTTALTAITSLLSVALDSSSPAAASFTIPQTSLAFAKIKIINNSDTNITNLRGIQVSSFPGTTGARDMSNIEIYDELSLLGRSEDLIDAADSSYTWISIPTSFIIPAHGSKILTIYADLYNGSAKLGIVGFHPESVKLATQGLPVYGQTMSVALAPEIVGPVTQDCVDTDGGKVYGTKGRVAMKITERGFKGEDYCSGLNLNEYSCTTVGTRGYELSVYTCPNGCLNGACRASPVTTPTISVIFPYGDEAWLTRMTYNIRWISTGIKNVKISLVNNFGDVEGVIASSVPASQGTYSWTIPSLNDEIAKTYRIEVIEDVGLNAINRPLAKGLSGEFRIFYNDRFFSSNFALKNNNGGVLTSPSGGEVWTQGTTHNITWRVPGSAGLNTRLVIWSVLYEDEYPFIAGSYFKEIISPLIPVSQGTYSWTIPLTIPVGTYKIYLNKPQDVYGSTVLTSADDYFSIVSPPGQIVTTP